MPLPAPATPAKGDALPQPVSMSLHTLRLGGGLGRGRTQRRCIRRSSGGWNLMLTRSRTRAWDGYHADLDMSSFFYLSCVPSPDLPAQPRSVRHPLGATLHSPPH